MTMANAMNLFVAVLVLNAEHPALEVCPLEVRHEERHAVVVLSFLAVFIRYWKHLFYLFNRQKRDLLNRPFYTH
jgi:hypothetical protein